MAQDVLVFAEQRDDRLHPAALQCVTPARAIAAQTGGQVAACVVGAAIDAAADAMTRSGVDRVVTVTHPSLAKYSVTLYRSALAGAIQRLAPRAVLMPATFMGRDLAPRVGAKLRAAVVTDAVGVAAEGDALRVRRPVYNGKAFAEVSCPGGRLAIISVRPNTFAAVAGGGSAPSESIPFEAAPGDDRLRVREVVRAGGDVKDVTEADIIVSGGRSLKNQENFSIIFELARELDAAVGASRAACDAGYQPHTRQVGLTGKTVTPKLYVACGISGAIQHLAGMRGSKVIVAINTDPEAPMMKIADYAVVGDLFKIVPLLTAEVRKLKH